jgi:two-component system, NtrC family, sensor kinase
MRRRSRAGGEPAKEQRRKTVARKSRVTSKAARPNSSSAAREETKVARLTRERDEALQQQRATADVLKVISRSTFDLQSVLDTLVGSAARLCEAESAGIAQQSGDTWRLAASYRLSPEHHERLARYPIRSDCSSMVGRVVLEKRAVQIFNVQDDPEYELKEAAKLGGVNTMLGVPLLREGNPIGVLVLQRRARLPFTDKQIESAETFADQAAIAIENTRLLNELRQRTTDLTGAFEQQRTASDLLQIISSSPGNLELVFNAVLENAVSICGASFGNMFLYEEDAFRAVAMHNAPDAYESARARAFSPTAR